LFQIDRPELKAAASPALLARGCVCAIGLDGIKAEAGGRWEKLRENVHTRLEALLRQKLGPNDFFAPLSESAYLVTMPSADAEDAQVTCLRVAHELHTEYLGQFDLGALAISSAAPGEGDSIVLNPVARENIVFLAERAGIADPSLRPPVPSIRFAYNPNERHVLESPPAFHPTWDSRNEAVTGYYCGPSTITFAHAPSEPVAFADLNAKERARVELSCLYQGVGVLARHLERGERFLMTFSVSFETLGSPVARMDFGSACRELPSDFRQYILFELAGIPAGAPQSRLAELITALRPFAKAVFAQVPVGTRSYAPFQGIGLQAIGLTVPAARPKAPEYDMREELRRLSHAAKQANLTTLLAGISTPTLVKFAHETSIQFLRGPLIGPPVAAPQSMWRLTWRDVARAATESAAAAG